MYVCMYTMYILHITYHMGFRVAEKWWQFETEGNEPVSNNMMKQISIGKMDIISAKRNYFDGDVLWDFQ